LAFFAMPHHHPTVGTGEPSESDRPVYLDHAAATPLAPEVTAAMDMAAAWAFANPSSPHAAGRRAKGLLEDARERILALLGGRTSGPERDRLIFTSGTTEANRLAIIGMAAGCMRPGLIGLSARDHGSLRAAARELGSSGWQERELGLAGGGPLAGDAVAAFAAEAKAMTGRPAILAASLVCGQTGTWEDTFSLAAIAKKVPGLVLHADAAQAVAWGPLEFASSSFATLALGPAKFGGPRGIGGLVLRHGTSLEPILPGPQELGLRGGTEAVTLAVGFARALELAVAEREATVKRVTALRDRFEAGFLGAAVAAGIEAVVVGRDSRRAPHIASLALAGVDRQAFVMAADLAGVCLATGTACASGASEPPVVLAALGLPERLRAGAIRASIGVTTTAAEIELATSRLERVLERLGRG
jgi:cysteine desulfurase